MQIHNFFSDLLLSMNVLFEDYIFSLKPSFFRDTHVERPLRSFIQTYQYNIGNRTFQVGNYKDSNQVELPAAIINLGSDEAKFGIFPGTTMHHKIQNINEIPVLYNPNNRKMIYLREQQQEISINTQINCESQMQAKEIEHQIKRMLPINKYIQIMSFTSFIEIPAEYLNQTDMDPKKNSIQNIYMKTDKQTGIPIFCFSVQYKPLIRLNSCLAEISDSSSKAWPVNCDFNYLIQLPMWIFADKDPLPPEKITITFGFNFEPISGMTQVIGKPFEFNGKFFNYDQHLIIRDEKDFFITKESNSEGLSFKDKYLPFINQELETFNIDDFFKNFDTFIETDQTLTKAQFYDKYSNLINGNSINISFFFLKNQSDLIDDFGKLDDEKFIKKLADFIMPAKISGVLNASDFFDEYGEFIEDGNLTKGMFFKKYSSYIRGNDLLLKFLLLPIFRIPEEKILNPETPFFAKNANVLSNDFRNVINISFKKEEYLIPQNPFFIEKRGIKKLLLLNTINDNIQTSFNQEENQIKIYFSESEWVKWKPQLTHPLFIHFLVETEQTEKSNKDRILNGGI